MAIEEINTKAELERFVKKTLEQIPLNTIQGLASKITELEARLKKGGL